MIDIFAVYAKSAGNRLFVVFAPESEYNNTMTTHSSDAPFYVVSGPSGSGKTSVCHAIANEYNWYYSVSHTTRTMREGEENGKDYYFVSVDEFKQMIEKGDLLEWAKVYDNYYGTSKKHIEERLQQGQGVILDLDTQGADQIKKLMPRAILVFIKTPDLDELRERLRNRGQDDEAEISKRMSNAENEMSHIDEYDHVILNDELDRAVNRFKEIIQNQ